jgi:hypothetical protein
MQGISSYNDRSNGKKSERGEGGVVSSHQDGGVTPDNFHVLVPPVFGPEGDHAARGIAVGSGAAGFRREEGAHLCLILLRSRAVAVRLVVLVSLSSALFVVSGYQRCRRRAADPSASPPLCAACHSRGLPPPCWFLYVLYGYESDFHQKKKDMKVTFLTCFFFLKRKKRMCWPPDSPQKNVPTDIVEVRLGVTISKIRPY